MLYPKRGQKLTPDDFKNPSSEYRGTPFWAWNNKLDKDELLWQIDQFKKMGFGGFHMHVRTGMATEYLSDEYMNIIGACIEKARKEKMLAWLYDEDSWPSGAAGGIVTKNPEYRLRHLLLTRKPYGTAVEKIDTRRSRGISVRNENGKLIACFDAALDENGDLKSYKMIDQNDNADGIKLYAYLETAAYDPWYNNQTYVNTLDPPSMREFIRVTYGAYDKRFKKDFGGIIPAIFTDEPQFSRQETLLFALDEEKDITIPWTFDIEDTYKAAYNGESLTAGIPELLWNLADNKVSKIRYQFHDHITERFTQAFADQCGQWCAQNGIMLTGHMNGEQTLESQTYSIGEAMRAFRSFQLPGIDMLCDHREFTTAKQAQSAARQGGIPGTLSELYGVTNWNFDFRGHKLQGDWQAALGVTVRVPHLSWVSMNGNAKRDYPSTFNYQSPWYEQYSYIEDHFARVASVLTRGKAVCRVGVIHPIESFWLHWGPKERTAAIREEMDEKFIGLCDWLLRGLIDFDYICESTLPEYCKIEDIGAEGFPVGEMKYEVVIVPALETMRKTTLRLLEAFKKAGGRIIFLTDAPKYIDAVPCDDGKKLFDICEQVSFERLRVLNALADIREIDIRTSSGSSSKGLLYQMREESGGTSDESSRGCRWLFIAHADNPKNPDIPCGDKIKISVRGEWDMTLYDTITGEISPLSVNWNNGWTVIERLFYDHDSLLVKLDPAGTSPNAVAADASAVKASIANKAACESSALIRFSGAVPVTLKEPNVLLLDIAQYALDSQDFRPAEEILRLDNILRGELNWPKRCDAVAQPWVETDTSTPHILKLRYTFESEIPVFDAQLALENAGISSVTLNGKNVGSVTGWYVDKCIGKIDLPQIKIGTNVLEVSLPYGHKIDVEAMYLLGDFGVNVRGAACVITKPVRSLSFGDITNQGLPFYGGNLIYHLEADIPEDCMTIRASNYRGHLLKIKVDGNDCGHLVFSPYEKKITGIGKGRHKIDIVYFGNRINTFGQLHCVERDPAFWWGPNSWLTTGSKWSYEYKLWPAGVLKSPEIF